MVVVVVAGRTCSITSIRARLPPPSSFLPPSPPLSGPAAYPPCGICGRKISSACRRAIEREREIYLIHGIHFTDGLMFLQFTAFLRSNIEGTFKIIDNPFIMDLLLSICSIVRGPCLDKKCSIPFRSSTEIQILFPKIL